MAVVLSTTPEGPHHVGDPVELVCKTTAPDGTAANPGAVIFRERRPDGAFRIIGATEVAVGTWTAPVSLDASGRWRFRVECSGAVAGADETPLNVRASAFPPLS
jgi:hypothetical protein